MELSEIVRALDQQSTSFDIRSLFGAFRRRIGLFLSTAALVAALVILITLQAQPEYTASANVLIDRKDNNVVDFTSVLTGGAPDQGSIDTEVEVIKSRALAEKVVNLLNLSSDPEFNPALRQSRSKSGMFSFMNALFPKPVVRPTTGEDGAIHALDNVTDEVLENLNVYRLDTTYVLRVQYTSHSPKKAADITNAFADNYLLEQLESKFESTSRANDWLNTRLEELRDEVRATEEAVEVYRTNSGLLSAQGSSLTEQQISDLNAQLIIQTSDYNEVQARLESVQAQIARGVPADTIAEVMTSAVIRDLRRQESEVNGRKAELSSRYGPRHPEVLKVDREAADIQAQIRLEIDRIVSSLESEVGIARQKVRTIENGLGRLRSQLSTNNRSLVRLRELEREAEASRTLYQNFLEQFKQINDQEEIAEADARVISKAVIPTEQSAPNTAFNTIMGILLGIFAGLGLVYLAEMLDNGLATGAEVEREIDVPFIASIPETNAGIIGLFRKLFGQKTPPEKYLVENPLSVYAESFRALRSTVLLSAGAKPPKVIAVTSALPNEGKTTVVKSIGVMSAMSGSKTVIVDCDFRIRGLSKDAPSQPNAGLIKLLKGEAKFKDVTVTDPETGCDYILNSEDEYTSKDLIGTKAFTELLTALRRKYDLVILDTAPVLMVAETRAIAQKSDRVVMAARWRRTKVDAVKTAVDTLQRVNANIIGLVLTRVNLNKRVKYGVGDYAYYTRQYGKYYARTQDGNSIS